jgi:hypothetical protein
MVMAQPTAMAGMETIFLVCTRISAKVFAMSPVLKHDLARAIVC